MPFFSDSIADNVQLISLPLEATGFFLTYLELFKKEKIDAFESLIEKVHKKVSSKKRSRLGFIKFISIALPLMVFVFYIEQLTAEVIIMSIVLTLVYFYDFTVVSLTLFIDFLKKLTNGRVAGSLGLTLAFLGILGEVYQVLNIFSY